MSCKCTGTRSDVWHNWRVLDRRPGGTSTLYCLACRWEWKSRAAYASVLRGHKKRVRSGLSDEDILQAVRDGKYRVDVDDATVYSRITNSFLTIHHRTHRDGTQRGTYRFVEFSIRGQKKKVALHRLVWMVANGRVTPDGHDVDHRYSQEDDSISNLRLLESSVNRGLPNKKNSEAF